MSIATLHWSATGPDRLRDYHLEYALTKQTSTGDEYHLLTAAHPSQINWTSLRASFTIWKNVDLDTPTDYGTWKLNHDVRDQSANIEIGALCMGGEGVTVPGPWGKYPFTIAHAWMGAAIAARVAIAKKMDAGGSFAAAGFQNGPMHVISTHAERALQTPDSDASLRPSFGYFAYSGDGDCRWDLAARDPSEAHLLANPDSARTSALRVAAWIRAMAHEIKAAGVAPSDMWGIDGPVTP